MLDYFDLLGKDLFLVGGQAVNLWAEFYLEVEPGLRKFLPLVSKDADFYRLSQKVPEKVEAPAGWTQVPFPRKGRMRLILTAFQGPKLQHAEVIRSVNGLTIDETEKGFVELQLNGKNITILNPILMFKAKAANVKTIDQERRQDVNHLCMMIIIAKCYLSSLLETAHAPIRPKEALKLLNTHLGTIREYRALPQLKDLQANDLFPMDVMARHPSDAVRNFHARLLSEPGLQAIPKPTSRLVTPPSKNEPSSGLGR